MLQNLKKKINLKLNVFSILKSLGEKVNVAYDYYDYDLIRDI